MLQRVTNQFLQLLGIVPALPSHAGKPLSPGGWGGRDRDVERDRGENKGRGRDIEKTDSASNQW